MSFNFTKTIITEQYVDFETDHTEEYGRDVNVSLSDEEVCGILAMFVARDYFDNNEEIIDKLAVFIEENGQLNSLVEEYNDEIVNYLDEEGWFE